MIRGVLRLCLCLALLGAGATSAAEFPEIDKARRHLQHAETELNRARGPRDQLAALSAAVTAQEAALSAFHSGLRAVALEDQALTVGLAQDRVQLAEYLGALQNIARAPKSALLVFPEGPVRAARAGILLAEITPVLEQQMTVIRTKLDEIRLLRAFQEAARIETRGALAGLQDLRLETARALRGRQDPPARADFRAQATAAQERARDLDQLAAALAAGGASDGALAPFASRKGTLALPVTGTIQAGFGEAASDRQRFGLVLSAPAYAQITAPTDATVRYAGPLIGYDQVVVLEPEARWMIVIAGLASIDRTVGETVLAGERLGDLGGPLPTSEEFLIDASNRDGQIAPETLYIEMRRDDKPVDPAGWFALDE